MYHLSDDEKTRLIRGIQAAYAVPFIHDITDYIWEAIFSYAKSLALVDPLQNTRSKLLFDVVDTQRPLADGLIGWSAKAKQLEGNLLPTSSFELVIQRADIFKKGKDLGFDTLNIDTPPDILGKALLQRWNMKLEGDAIKQKVSDRRICILVKSKNRNTYCCYENMLTTYLQNDLEWTWTDVSRTGLQGARKADRKVVYRWYPNQKQFFEKFTLPENAWFFSLAPRRLPIGEAIDILLNRLDSAESFRRM